MKLFFFNPINSGTGNTSTCPSGPKVTTPCPPPTHTLTRTNPRVPSVTATLLPPPRLRSREAVGAQMPTEAAAPSAQRGTGPRLCLLTQLHPAGPGQRGPAESKVADSAALEGRVSLRSLYAVSIFPTSKMRAKLTISSHGVFWCPPPAPVSEGDFDI